MDQTVFIQQGGKNKHEDICESLELFAKDVMPEFKGTKRGALATKKDELAPYVEAAFKRKEFMKELKDSEIPAYQAYGFNVAEIDVSSLPEAQRQRALRMREMRDILRKVQEKVGCRQTSRQLSALQHVRSGARVPAGARARTERQAML